MKNLDNHLFHFLFVYDLSIYCSSFEEIDNTTFLGHRQRILICSLVFAPVLMHAYQLLCGLD